MKTDLVPPQTGYRNDVVFRSAERLLASAPKKRAREQFPRWAIFAVGLGLGIGLTLAARTLWHGARTDYTDAPAPMETLFRAVWPRPNAIKRGSTLPTQMQITSAAPTASPHEQTNSSNVPAQDADIQASETPRDRTSHVAVAAFLTSNSTRADLPAQATPSVIVLSAARFFTAYTWRGELRSDTAAPIAVEFFVRGLDTGHPNDLFGSVDFLNGEDHFASNRIEGKVINHTLTLHETKNFFTLKGPAFSVGRTFVINLPADPGDINEINGTWSFGSENGALVLAGVLP